MTEAPSASQPPASDEARILARAMIEALLNTATDDAQRLYADLCEAEPRARDMQVYPMLFAAQRGQLLDFYRDLRERGEDHHPELQALCLQRLGDPLWEQLARRVGMGSSDPHVRRAMRSLLGDKDLAA